MKIKEVTLENIKSYEERTSIDLQGGVTAILGENGSGKSTIQEAIGFTLFDSLPFNNNEFVREGASSGTVDVTIELEQGGEVQQYRITRSAGRANYDVARFDETNEEWVSQDIDSKSALIDWLCVRFDVEDRKDLQSLWKSCVGVPQTRFLSDFAQTPRNRKQTFDELLGVDAYEESFTGALKRVPETIEEEQNRIQGGIQQLTGEVQNLPSRRNEKSELEGKVESLIQEISKKKSELGEVKQQFEELDCIKDRIEELEDEIAQVDQDVGVKKDALETAKAELKTARQAAEKCEEAKEGHDQYEEAKELEKELSGRKKELDTLEDQHRKKQAELEHLQEKKETLQQQAQKYNQAKRDLEAYEDQKERYENLGEQISDLENSQDAIDRFSDKIDDLDNQAHEALQQLRAKQELIAEIEAEAETAPNAKELRDQISDRKVEQRSNAAERKDIENHLEILRDAEAKAPCPTCGGPLDSQDRQERINEQESRLEKIESECDRLINEISDLQTELEEAENVEERFSKLDIHYEQAAELEAKLADLQQNRKEKVEKIEELEEQVSLLPSIREKHASLEDAKDSYYKANARVDEFADAPKELEKVESTIEETGTDIDRLEGEIGEFEGVEEELNDVKETLSECEEDYKKYEQNKQAADQLEQRQKTVEGVEDRIDRLEENKKKLKEDLLEDKNSFDSEKYQQLDERIDSLKQRLTELSVRKSERVKKLEEVTSTVDRLEEKLEERSQKVEALRNLAADYDFATWVRENVRKAGPKMREVITNRIGTRANTIFRSIRGRKAEQLEWTSDYDIVVVDADVRKSFSTLSGGEKMAAALAVRLAILEQMSSLGIAFLDEPTANLDQHKKSNLVDQLNALDVFEQLTVISHDSTFESMTDYSITIEKPEQTSEVVSD
ncbi:AAA family ATPase [Haladaptatus sp. DFWS20]|uniref:AAA family ATPase n=1 Tax=Haladaptatus sp. DFWS20 TaxID=3403467 RepID=UPI003EB9A477